MVLGARAGVGMDALALRSVGGAGQGQQQYRQQTFRGGAAHTAVHFTARIDPFAIVASQSR
ncbi:MAG: hypothetical protein M5U09_28680 [Gammaproteobacteria bacterium]|nr:hypothetical protein [Gammaproteobacteria bacterium]